MNIVRLDLVDKKGYNLSERFKRQLKFLSAKSYEERKNIAIGDETLMELNEWLEEYKNDESLREFFDEKKWSNIIGRIDGQDEKANEIAKKMIVKETPIEDISEITGLSIEEIENLQDEN